MSACWRYLIVSQHSTLPRPHLILSREQLDVVISIHSIRACISMSIKRASALCRCSLTILLPNSVSVPISYPSKVTIIVRDCSILIHSKIIPSLYGVSQSKNFMIPISFFSCRRSFVCRFLISLRWWSCMCMCFCSASPSSLRRYLLARCVLNFSGK